MEKQKTIFGKIIAALLSVFAQNWQSFVAKLWKKVPDELQDKVSIGVRIVEKIKDFVNSPTADFLTHLIPGDLDDKVQDYLKELLPKILAEYGNITELNEISGKMAHNIATDINHAITGLSYGQTALTTEIAYQNLKNEVNA